MEKIKVYVIKVIIDNVEKFATRSEQIIKTLYSLPGATAFTDITEAATELHYNYRQIFRGDAYLETIELPDHYIVKNNQIVFDTESYQNLLTAE